MAKGEIRYLVVPSDLEELCVSYIAYCTKSCAFRTKKSIHTLKCIKKYPEIFFIKTYPEIIEAIRKELGLVENV